MPVPQSCRCSKIPLSPGAFGVRQVVQSGLPRPDAVHIAPEWRTAPSLEESWLARVGAEDFAGLTKYTESYLPGARRFDVGETCTAALPGALVALEQIGVWTVEAIALRLTGINSRVVKFLEEKGFQVAEASTRCPHMVGALLPESYRGDLVDALRVKGVFVGQRGNSLRFAPHMHVTDSDVARLFQAIDDILGFRS